MTLAGSLLALSAPPAGAGHELGQGYYPTCEPGHVPDAPFADTVGSPHELGIECLHWLGLVQGVTPDAFAPAARVRRDQMASLIARTLTALRVPLPAGEDRFVDVDGNTHEDNIERLAAAGVIYGTGACSADRTATGCTYDPAGHVTRAQMATLLVRAIDAMPAPYAPTCNGRPDYFSDDDGSAHESNINMARSHKVVSGKEAAGMYEQCLAQPRGLYAPEDPVRRDQAATFLARLLNLGVQVAPGSYQVPFPRGTSVTLKDGWAMTVIASDEDATLEVMAHNPLNDPPAEGHQFMIARVRATYTGAGTSTFDGGGRLGVRGAYAGGNNPDGSADKVYPSAGRPCGDIPGELQNPELAEGGTVEGNVCVEIEEQPDGVPSQFAAKIVDRRWDKPGLPHFSRFVRENENEDEASPYDEALRVDPAS